MPLTNKISVLFVASGNAELSHIAQALLRFKGPEYFAVYGVEAQPDTIAQQVLNAMSLYGLSGDVFESQSLSACADVTLDYVITLCENDESNANDKTSASAKISTNDENRCQHDASAAQQLTWNLPSVKAQLSENPFLSTLEALTSRIAMFVSMAVDIKFNKPCASKAPSNKLSETTIDPIRFYKCLTDDIRLKTLMLTHYHGELCVCELMYALQEDSQPKVSRNLAVLKKANILSSRKHEQWVFYRMNVAMPAWVTSVIAQTTENNIELIREPLQRLTEMQTRPNKASICG
jgi:ArsR family transcriptional regulator